MDEAEALRLCREKRDRRGFTFLIDQYRREAFFHALGFMGNEHDAADAVQEAFFKAYAAIPRLKRLDRFYPWFYRILKNLCLNQLKRRKARALENEGGVEERSPMDPVVLAEKDERRARIWKALGELEPRQREILVLKHIRGLKYAEIAERLGIPRGTVMSRLFHARKTFRGRFPELAFGGAPSMEAS